MSSILSPKQKVCFSNFYQQKFAEQAKQILAFSNLPKPTTELVANIIKNVANHPNEQKFHSIKTSVPKYAQLVAPYPDAVKLLNLAGFEEKNGVIGMHTVTPKDVEDMKILVDIVCLHMFSLEQISPPPVDEEAIKRAQKAKEEKQKELEHRKALKAQLEAHKTEVKDVPSKSLKAKKLGEKSQITRFKDVGVDLNKKG